MRALSWPEFFALRQRLRWTRRIGGVPGVLGFLLVEGTLLSMPVFDPTQTVFGVDPLLAVGAATLAGTVGAYFGGGAAGLLAWRWWRPALARAYEQRRADFCRRIACHRANVPPSPTDFTFSQDFYGERIGSVAGYRTWLRRQNQLRNGRLFKIDAPPLDISASVAKAPGVLNNNAKPVK